MRRDNEYFLKITNKEFDEKVKDRREYEEMPSSSCCGDL